MPVHVFERFHGVPVKLKILLLGPGPEVMQVWLVPHFKEQSPHFFDPVTFNPVLRQLANERRPFRVVLRRRHVAAIAKDGFAARGQGSRHQTQFDKGLHADGQEEVPDLVGIEERIEGIFLVGDERPHVVGEQAMKAQVAKAQLVVATPQLRLAVRAQCHRRMVATDGVLPKVRKRGRRPSQVTMKLNLPHLGTPSLLAFH